MKTRLKELRNTKKITQTALSVNIGCSQNTISRIELGEAVPNAEILIELSKYFNTSVDYILCLTDQKNNNSTISPSSRLAAYCQKLQALTKSDREFVYNMIDRLSQNT